VKFLKELKQQTKKRSQLRHILILILRILAIASIVIAFAQPFIPVGEEENKKNAQNIISIYVDNSFSMEARHENGNLLDIAKLKAREVTESYHSSDLFQLITNDFDGIHQRLVSKDEFNEMLDNVNVSSTVRTLNEILSRQADIMDDKHDVNKYVFIISDLQRSTMNPAGIREDSTIFTYLIPVQAIRTDNIYIDSCWFESPVNQLEQTVKLVVRVKNASGMDYEKIPVKLFINNNQKALASFDVEAGKYSDIKLPFTNYEAGSQYATLEITDYPIVYDDKFYISYKVYSSIPILIINGNGENTYLNSLYGPDPLFDVQNVEYRNVNYSSFIDFSLIIINELPEISSGLAQELVRYTENGGKLIILPAEEPDFNSYNILTGLLNAATYGILDEQQLEVSFLDTDHQVYTNVFDKIPGEGIQICVFINCCPIILTFLMY